MVDTTTSDDLSGGTSATTNKANRVLDDASTRRNLRLAVSAVTVLVIAGLGAVLYMTVCALLGDLAFISVPAVSFATALIVAISGLTIALLHAIFADKGPDQSSPKDGPPVTTPGIEFVKAVQNMIETIIKGPNGKQ